MYQNELLDHIIRGEDLSYDQTIGVMTDIMEGKLTNAQMSAILVLLRTKGETVEEISACATVMREKSTKIPTQSQNLLDTCGTGGDGSGSFNISTTVGLLLASGGYSIAKHGNRSMTSKSGSADLLEALGVNLELTPDQVAECIEQTGIGFLFAPALHSAMKHVAPVRKELGVRTVFNILGPLTNPAKANYQIMGVYSIQLVSKIIRVLKLLGIHSAYVFAGESGLDEVCIAGNSQIGHLTKEGNVEEFIFNPEDYGFKKAGLDEIKGGSPEENAEITKGILSGQIRGPKRDIVIINAGFGISVIENCSLAEAFEKATAILDKKTGLELIDKLATQSRSYQ
ncbi:MAG: anthranilate phosphoribosyltransferase [Deltaproteobacteria bacterium]|nr:anthranilate phosphoribosyltransferase [Deltaproteobacteria bacterium]MBT4527282.1 anthranilate phosphoribosyltransferase [Deltaproteobacteria bacterium]